MSDVYGRLLTCDRCGKHIFYESGQKRPENWETAYLNPFGSDISHLCPDCAGELKAVIRKYMLPYLPTEELVSDKGEESAI